MDTHADLVKWLRTMGFNGDIPESLISICNNSTMFIWEDLMQNVQPKQEVEKIKRNIILNRLKTKHIGKQDDFAYRNTQIDIFRKKMALEQKCKLLKECVKEKQYKVEKLSQNCKVKDISINYLRNKIKEHEERNHLLDLKKEQLEGQKNEAAATLTKLKNVTPVEMEESTSSKEVAEILEKCALKLNETLTNNLKTHRESFQRPNQSHSTHYSKSKKPVNQSSIATYLTQRENQDFEEISRSCVKKEKENIPLNVHNPISKKLVFAVPQVIAEDTEKHVFECLEFNESRPIFSRNEVIIPKKRESLGLLPDSCFSEVQDESFLQQTNISSINHFEDFLDHTDQHVSVTTHKSELNLDSNSDSVMFNSRKRWEDRGNMSSVVKKKDKDKREQLYNDVFVNKNLEQMLHENNRKLIFDVLRKVLGDMNLEFTKIVSVYANLQEKKVKINESDITKLQFIHVQTELKIMNQKRILKDLVAKITNRKLYIMNSIRSKEDITDIQDWLDLNIKQVGLDASLAAINKEIDSAKTVDNDEMDLEVLSSKIVKAKGEIATKISLIRYCIEELYKTQKCIVNTREEALSPIWHIRLYRTDIEWMKPLLENLCFEEMKVFEEFPLEYSRRCSFTNSKIFYRDLCTDNYLQHIKMEPELLQMLIQILESPFSPPETILLNLIKSKMKLDRLKTLRNENNSQNFENGYCRKYLFEDLLKQESYLSFSIDQLRSIMCSSNANKTLAIGDVIRKTMEIWTKMPMKQFISPKRQLEGQSFQFYENKLNNFL